ncbi:MAG: DUF6169 family protein [Bacteroidota bacterium]
MFRRISDFYTYIFSESDGIPYATFESKTGTGYRVYFYPISEYFESIKEGTLIYSHGFFFGFTKVAPNEDKIEPPDFKVRNTIIQVINDFFGEKGKESVLIFHCDGQDGKKHKRATHFDNWFDLSDNSLCFKKINEEVDIAIITEDGLVFDKEYLSLIIECSNPNYDAMIEEFQSIKNSFLFDK